MLIPAIRSAAIWTAIAALVIVWCPLVALRRLFDRDPVRYATGRLFRNLGVAMTKVNPAWRIHVDSSLAGDPHAPYVVVSNHQSLADIPLLSHLPWEMKWVAKEELFRVPFVGWMMRLAGDIAVDRSDPRSGAAMLLAAHRTLRRKCSVMFFPEGTRSRDTTLGRFHDGAFHLAITAGVSVLPVVIDGSSPCLPRNTWKFGPPVDINVRVLPAAPTSGMTAADAPRLREQVRNMIQAQLDEWHAVRTGGVPLRDSSDRSSA